MSLAATLSEAARSEVRRIVLISRIAGLMVGASLATAAIYTHRGDLLSPDAVFTYFVIGTGLAAFVTISTLARIGHAHVLERSLTEVGSLTGQLRDLAERDPLTGLYNLRTFNELLAREIEVARANDGQLSLIVADLDNFKVLNDSYGHQFGDDVLRHTASVFSSRAGVTHAAARLGGDEFAILLSGMSREGALAVARQIEAGMLETRIDALQPETMGSFGIGAFPDDGDNVQALFAAADGRMYSEKHRRKAEALSSLAGAARKVFERAGRAMRPDRATAQVLQDIATAAVEEFSLTLCAIRIAARGHHPALSAAGASPDAQVACRTATRAVRLDATSLASVLPGQTWLIETPVPDDGDESGVLVLAGLPTASFRPDAAVVVALADLIQAAVANGRAHDDAVRIGRERDIHIDLAHALAGSDALEERLALVAELIQESIGVLSVSIEGLEPSHAGQSYDVASALPAQLVEPWRAARASAEGREFIRRVAASGSCVIDDPAADDRVPEFERRLVRAGGIVTSVICPIRFDGQLLGVLGAVSAERGYFTETLVAELTTVADHLAPAISAALLRDELEASYAQLEQASRESLARLADAAEARDPHTAGHLRRIRHYSVELARQLGVAEEQAEAIGAASTVHDLGKLSLPDDVLMKPGKLTPDDWDLMRQHPLHGERLIGDSPKFEVERSVARWHHERWDGTGYPDGLRGEEIPLAARIVAVADAFDALTTERPYKLAWSIDEALAEIARMKGKLFCPSVTAALEVLWRSGRLAAVYGRADSEEHAHNRRLAA